MPVKKHTLPKTKRNKKIDHSDIANINSPLSVLVNTPIEGLEISPLAQDDSNDIAPFDFAVDQIQDVVNDIHSEAVGFTANIPVKRFMEEFEMLEDGTVMLSSAEKKEPEQEQPQESIEYAQMSDDDKQLVHGLARKVSPDEIAKQIGCNPRAVYRYMQIRGLLSEDDRSDWRIKQAQLNELRSQAFYPALQKSYSTEELTYFEDEWVRVAAQFKDNITASERITLKQAIEISIKMQRLSIKENEMRLQIQEKRTELDEVNLCLSASDDKEDIAILNQRRAEIQSLIAGFEGNSQTFDKNWRDFSDTHTKLMSSLSATRDKRVDKGDSVDVNSWNKILQAIAENPPLKKQLNSAAYLAFIAEERVRSKLSRSHTYTDGDIMPPILTSETVQGRNSKLGDMINAAYVPQVNKAAN